MASADMYIGRRVAHLRELRGWTQTQLVAKIKQYLADHGEDTTGISQPYLSKIERGLKPVTKRSTLYAFAEVLGVPNTELTGMPLPLRTREDLLPYSTVTAIRAALDYPDEPITPRPIGELETLAGIVLRARMECEYDVVGAALPGLIAESKMLYEDAGLASGRAGRVLVKALVAGSLALKTLGWIDLAIRCAGMARNVTRYDPEHYAAAEFAYSQCILSAGNRRRSLQIVGAAIEDIRPDARGNTMNAWQGMLHLQAGFTAASLGDDAALAEHFGRAQWLTDRVEGNPWWMEFGVANYWTWRAGAALENGEPERAPEYAAKVKTRQLLSRQRKSRLWMDAGRGHYLAGQPDLAIDALLRADKIAPKELRTRPAVVEIVGQMRRDAKRPNENLQRLAKACGVAA